ncbi:MAG: peroxiredoxin [Chloroflexi bacterium]|nr:peroxiredoxin [Chloroflexota bacterium]
MSPNERGAGGAAPPPIDDGAAAHLVGMRLPALALPATHGTPIDLSALRGRTVVYCYPRTSRPDCPSLPGWDSIPGARGCTPQSGAFRDHHAEILELGAQVFGMSTQDTEYQREAVERLHLPFLLLSDAELRFSNALRLPTFNVEGHTLLKRLTFIARDGTIEATFYPVHPPESNAEDVIGWLRAHGA